MQIEALLIKNDAWGYVNGEILKPEGIANENAMIAWNSADSKAKSDLILSIHPSELKQVKGCATSREVWLKLESIYQSKGPARKATLLKQLMLQKMEDSDDAREHVRKFFDAVDKLTEMEVAINNDLLTIMLLYSLPPCFENFRCAIESRDDLPTPETLRVKVIEESDARKNDIRGTTQNAMIAKRWNQNKGKAGNSGSAKKSGNSANKEEFKYRCHRCRAIGHKSVDCKNKRENIQPSAKNAEDVVLSAVEYFADAHDQGHEALRAENDTCDRKWCIDSGATSHLSNEIREFVEIDDMKCGKLNLASSDSTEITAKGTMSFTTEVDGETKNIKLKNVLYVPDLRANLLSVAKMTDRDCEVLFTKRHATVTGSDGNIKAIADRTGDLYYVREIKQESCEKASETLRDTEKSSKNLKVWHRRLGHLNVQDLRKADQNKAVLGVDLGKSECKLECEICLRGKMTRTPFPKKSERKTEILDIVHSDLCGPMRVESKGRAKYFMTFIDDSSRWCEVRFLKKKSEAFEVFKDFKALVENQKGRKMKCLQSDNGTEYLSTEFNEYLKKHGIQRRLTIAYNPEQNGTAERKNRTLLEMARCLLIQSGLPSSFWAEAVSTANYIRNRCPTRSLDGRTPYEAWTGGVPNVSHFQEFGCNTFVLDRDSKKGKLEERGKKGIFLGYSEELKGYRVWIPEEKKIETTRDVEFLKSSTGRYENGCEDFLPENSERKEDVSTPHTVDIEIKPLGNHPIDVPVIEEREDDERNEGEENEIDENEDSAEYEDDENNDAAEEERRGPGRPRKILTGLRGRPRKQYQPPQGQARYVQEAFVAEIPTKEAVIGPDGEDWLQAMAEEVKSILKNDTWLLVERPENKKIIGSRMVLRNKYKPDGSLDRRKARIVARGFAQQPGIHFNQTFAPVARLSSIRLLVALAANYGMTIKQLDVTTAYLNGVIKEEIFMETPKYLTEALETVIHRERSCSEIRIKAEKMLQELETGDKVCLLKKSLYGLRQSGRSWHEKLDEMMRKFGATPTNADPCVYYIGQGEDALLIAVYVDDILVISRNKGKITKFKEYLSQKFEIKDLGEPKYCLGIEFTRDGNRIAMQQRGYIRDVLERFRMTDSKPVSTPMDVNVKLIKADRDSNVEDTKLPFRELVGALMYLAIATRPDIAYAVSALSQFNTCFGETHWTAAKRVLRYLKGSAELGLVFEPGAESLKGYVDADWASCSMDRRSYTGYTFILGNGAVSWESKKQRTVALSSTEAEYMGLAEAAKETMHLREFLKELGFENLANATVLNDNMGAKRLAENPIFHARTKHIDVRHHFVREALQKKQLKLEHVSTDDMVADMLTKALPRPKHQRCLNMLGLGSLSSPNEHRPRLEGKCCIE